MGSGLGDARVTAGERVFATFIVMGKNILILTDGGQLLLFAANRAKFEAPGRA